MKEKTPEEGEAGKQWFDLYVDRIENHSTTAQSGDGAFLHCPCCGGETLSERGSFEICEVCWWEDDGQDDEDANTIRGGPNGALSLTQARKNYQEMGVCERRFLEIGRLPLP